MGCGYNDVYVLAPERSFQAAMRFLDRFLPNREPASEEYRFPESSEAAEATFQDPIEAIAYAAPRAEETQRFYFRNKTEGDGLAAHAMVFLTADGGMILGVSVPARQEDRLREAAEVARWLADLESTTDAETGYALYESPPPCETIGEFLDELAVALPPKLVNGRLVLPTTGQDLGVVWLDWSR